MYEVIIEGSARKQIERFSEKILKRVDRALTSLENNPRHSNVEKLTGYNLWRIRVGYYRIIFEIDDAQKKVIVYKIKHRKEVYRRL